MHQITVDEAIRKGQRMINWPITFIFMALGGGIIFAAKEGMLPGWANAAGIVLALVAAWLYWSIMIVRWRIWAFDNVNNVHDLYKRAITERLIWPDGSWASKTEIWTQSQREKWEAIKTRFNKPEVFENDFTVPSETIIYYSRSRNFTEMAVMLALAGFGVYLIAAEINLLFGIVMVAIGIFFAVKEFRQATNTEPQITLNEKGITTASHGATNWEDITEAEVILERSGRNLHAYLVYSTPLESIKISIEDFDTDRNQLYHLVKVYRGRASRRRT